METWHQMMDEIIAFTQDSTYFQIFLKTLAAAAVTFVCWFVGKRILVSVETRIAANSRFRIDETLFEISKKLFLYLLILLSGTYLIRLYGLRAMENAFYALLIVMVSVHLKDFVLWLLTYLETHVAGKTETKIDDIIFELLKRFSGVIIIATAAVLALDVLGINVMPFIAGAGVAGIAIGFAAKDTLSNLIAGVLLIVDRPFEVGDRIEVWSAPSGSATWGDVVDIGLRATRIKTTDHITIIIPNNEIMTRDIVNYTVSSGRIRVRINVGVAYDADIERAKAAVLRVADSAEWILKDPPPKVVVVNFGASSVDLQARVWIADARRRIDTISYMTDRIKAEFDREGIEIPYPKRDITIRHVTPAPEVSGQV